MKRVLLLGLNPLPVENNTCTLAPGKRTWQFLYPLLNEGHRVCLVCSRHLAATQNAYQESVSAEEHGNLVYYSVAQNIFENRTWLQRIHDFFDPDCIVGATAFPSYIATRLKTDRPIWADLFGHIMAEAQTKSHVFNDNYYITHLWEQERALLDRADVFSVVSKPQSYAAIGELGTRFRLNRATTGYEFTRVIPCSISDQPAQDESPSRPILRGQLVPDDAFIILWSGGYNTWTDIRTLFQALEAIFEQYPHVYFVSTGGEIASHDEITYREFLNKVEQSSFRDRYIMRGWIPFNEVPAYIKESDIGINIDLFSYEGILGSRNRMMDWMQMKLPILTSELCELSWIIRDHSLGLTFKPEDSEGLIQAFSQAITHPDQIRNNAEKAYRYCYDHYTSDITTKPLVEWVSEPCHAPDYSESFSPHLDSSPRHINNVIRHYHASVMNNIRSGGILHTLKWIVSRSPGFRKLFRSAKSKRAGDT